MKTSLSEAFGPMWFFSVWLNDALRRRDEMQVVYKEITSGGAKSIVEKWNLISEIQFKQVKNCLTVM